MKILSFLAPFILKIKTADICNFWSVNYFGKCLLFLKIWHIKVNYCWSYGPLNLLFRFFRYRLGHFDNRQTKIVENSTIYFLRADTKMFIESFKVFDPTITKWRSFNFFAKLNGNHILKANFSKLRKCQTFVLIELRNLGQG